MNRRGPRPGGKARHGAMPALAEPILILSDVHYAHPACLLDHWTELQTLIQGARTVIFNGDTVEMRYSRTVESARGIIEQLRAYCASLGAEAIFVTGNHDPIISDTHQLDLAGGQVLVMHGDVLFDEITPWSREAKVVRPAHLKIMEAMGGKDALDLDGRLVAARRACLEFEKIEVKHPPNVFGKITAYLQEFWPPTRPLRILKIWGDTPGIAAAFAQQFRPGAGIVVMGHTHRSGVWSIGGHTVINTGSFTPLSGRLGLWLEGDSVRVRKIVRRAGQWVFGRDAHVQRLKPVPALELASV